MKVYRVEGGSGQYSDRAEWTAACFFKQEDAQKFIDHIRCIEEAIKERSNKCKLVKEVAWGGRDIIPGQFVRKATDKFITKLDPNYYSGLEFVSYYIEEIEVR